MVKVSVILPAYNAADTVGEAIESILRQTWTDWELIVINDGSKDKTKEEILGYTDERIRYIENDGNKGLIYTLNRGLELAKGEYIARMDADDISLPARLEKQVRYLDAHKDVVVLGTGFKTFGEGITSSVVLLGEDDKQIKANYLTEFPFAHPTVMMRRVAGLRYNGDYKNAEDYRLWLDLMSEGRYHNLQEVLLHYRISPSQVTQRASASQQEATLRCRWEFLALRVGADLAEEMKQRGIHVDHIRRVKALVGSQPLLRALYLSLQSYGLRETAYYIFSGDVFRLGTHTAAQFIKRLLGRRAPYLY